MPRKHTYAVEVWISSDATRRLNYDGESYPTHTESETLYLKLADRDAPLTAEESRFLARLAAHYYRRLIDETPGPEPCVMADPDAEYEADTYYEVLGGQTGAWEPPVLVATHARRIKYASTKTGTLPPALRMLSSTAATPSRKPRGPLAVANAPASTTGVEHEAPLQALQPPHLRQTVGAP